MRTSQILRITLTLLVASTKSCGEFCSVCTKEYNCTQCYQSELTYHGDCVHAPGIIPNCLLSGRAQLCLRCNQNTTLDFVSGKCIPLVQFIPNCVSNIQIRTRNLCVVCGNGTYPDRSQTKCIDYDVVKYPDCVWSSRKQRGGDLQCVRCAGALSADEKGVCGNYNATGCVEVSKADKKGKRTCLACNVFNGFSMKIPGDLKCFTPYSSELRDKEAFAPNLGINRVQ